MTPRQFDALCRRYDRKRRDDRRAGDQIVAVMVSQLTAMVANTGFRSFEKPKRPAEFMPKYEEDKGKPQTVTQRIMAKRLERNMERAVRYQAAQVARGVD